MLPTVAVFVGQFPPAVRGGGPVRSVDALVQSASGIPNNLVVTSSHDLGEAEPLDVVADRWTTRGAARVWYAGPGLARLWSAVRGASASAPKVVYFNSFFNPRYTILPLLAWRLGLLGSSARVLAPRGEFGSGAIQRRRQKKRAYIAFFRLLRLDRGMIWHSTAPHESSDIRALWGADATVIERANDVLLPTQAMSALTTLGRSPQLVFLGRIVEHKGLHIALLALQGVSAPVTFHIYGSEEDSDYLSQCVGIANSLPAHIEVEFRGVVAPDEVRAKLNEYDALVLPTSGENFGHVIAEALSAATVVVTTPYTPWTETLTEGGGVVVGGRDVSQWHEALDELVRSTTSWASLRQGAGHAYEEWMKRDRQPHLFTSVLDKLAKE